MTIPIASLSGISGFTSAADLAYVGLALLLLLASRGLIALCDRLMEDSQ